VFSTGQPSRREPKVKDPTFEKEGQEKKEGEERRPKRTTCKKLDPAKTDAQKKGALGTRSYAGVYSGRCEKEEKKDGPGPRWRYRDRTLPR